MALSSFGSVTFKVMAERPGFFPLPRRGDDRALHYRATIELANGTDADALAANLAVVNAKPILGAVAAVVSADSASSAETLTIPVAGGTAGTYTGYLIDFAPLAAGRYGTVVRAECEWIVGG